MAQNNPYSILGIDKNASDKEIKSAYRRLSKRHHPDLNPGSKEAGTKFKEINKAYQILSNPEKRARYDRGEINMEGEPEYKPSGGFYRDYADKAEASRYFHENTGHFDTSDIQNIFSSFFTGGTAGNHAGFKKQPSDVYYNITIDFMESVSGERKRVTMPDGKVLDIKIPAGVEDGQRLRLKGQGAHGSINSESGDAYINIHITPHKIFTRKARDIFVEVPVGFNESLLGSKITVPTIHGPVEVTIPKNSSTGDTLRLKNKGIKNGDQYIKIKIVMPNNISESLMQSVVEWDKASHFNPREKMEAMV